MAQTEFDFDVLIVGGGMVGGSLAVALGETGYRVGLVEAFPYGEGQQPAYDDRAIALAYGSARIFQGMGLWSELSPEATAIKKIHVSDRGHLGTTRLDCSEEGVDALGYVIESRSVGRVLSEQFTKVSNLTVIAPAKLESLEQNEDHVQVSLDCEGTPRSLTARLLVAADGTMSPIRKMLGVEVDRHDYRQAAVIANISTEQPHHFVAYERFTDSGPLALLPMSDGRCSLVWTHRTEELSATEGLDDDAFLRALQERFGYRLGRFTRVGRRASYPLALMRALEDYRGRVVLIGNASHTLHPVAGQGFNLGLRDVAVLADLLFDASKAGKDPGDRQLMSDYSAWRKEDLDKVAQYTDFLVRVFSNPWGPIGHARACGLTTANMLRPVKQVLARQSMGLQGHLPRLARGLSLHAYPDREAQ
jgi:2-octaprenyl-6-methoxyphenol hydroxylase